MKIKAKTLAAEARFIRKEEIRLKKMAKAKDPNGGFWHPDAADTRQSLYEHRMGLRKHSRATHLARAFLKGQAYCEVEFFTRVPVPYWLIEDVTKMAIKYNDVPVPKEEAAKVIRKWIEAA